MKSTSLLLVLCGGIACAACGDDSASSTGDGGAGGSGPSTTASTSSDGPTTASGTPASTSSDTSSSSGEGGGGAGGAGQGGSSQSVTVGQSGTGQGGGGQGGGGQGGDGVGGSGQGGDGQGGSGQGGDGVGGSGQGGGAGVCPEVLIGEESEALCELDVDAATSDEDTATCTDADVTWLANLYTVAVEAGDCVYIRADNVGSNGADLFGAIIDPAGANLLFDEEADCTEENVDGFACPEGAITMSATGDATIVVGAFVGSEACELDTPATYQLSVTVNGTDVDLSGGPVCEGDLYAIIP